VLISGASYGGYATMAGLVYTPELYCAGINYVGVVDINNLIPKAQASDRMYWFNTRIADLGNSADKKRLHDTSPVNFAERIRVPLLMAYGKNDPRVRIDQAYDIERALKRANVPYELIIQKDEGHGFRTEEKRIDFYKRIDAFLKQHVPTAAP
jgi:dipeptidyl aminopeptidase/acylaminoacyl peptidase